MSNVIPFNGITKLDLEQQPAAPVGDDWTPCMKLPVVVHVRKQRDGETHISTREGITPVKPDDFIMRGVSGEEYPIGREIFEKTYTLEVEQPAAPAIPEGWKLVPVEPTTEMLEAFKHRYKEGDFWRERIHGAVAAMLAAAPEKKGN